MLFVCSSVRSDRQGQVLVRFKVGRKVQGYERNICQRVNVLYKAVISKQEIETVEANFTKKMGDLIGWHCEERFLKNRLLLSVASINKMHHYISQ